MDTAPSCERPLIVSHNAGRGGSNQVVMSLLRHRPAGTDPTCVFLAGGPMAQSAKDLGARVFVLRAGSRYALWRVPFIVQRLRRLIDQTRADLVFAHVPKAHAFASLAARWSGAPYLWWQHDPPHVRPRAQRVAARLPAQAAICSSQFSAGRFRALPGTTPVVTIPCGTEIPDTVVARVHDRSSGARVGSAGRLQRYKRHDLFLQAAPRILRDAPSTRFIVLGGPSPGIDPGYREELVDQARSLGVAVNFTGEVEDAATAIGELDVLVHPAEQEPFGLVLIEAMLRGVPVVCRHEGGPAEIVRDGIDGLHVDVEDPEALARAVASLLADPARRAAMGRAGAERVRAAFSAQRMSRECWSLMGAIAARHRQRRRPS